MSQNLTAEKLEQSDQNKWHVPVPIRHLIYYMTSSYNDRAQRPSTFGLQKLKYCTIYLLYHCHQDNSKHKQKPVMKTCVYVYILYLDKMSFVGLRLIIQSVLTVNNAAP